MGLRVDLGQRTRSLIAALAFALLSVGFFLGAAIAKWIYQ